MSTAEDEAREMIGRKVGGKFVIESRIGGGAMGDVFLAKHVALDTHVALKIMHEELAKDPRFAERFHREAKAASKLNHPNSVRVIDFGQDDAGLIYLAMELLAGRDLLKVLNEDWPIPPERIVAILSQALGALQVAHDHGIVHRDLKPENIMIVPGKDDEGNAIDIVKVCDFGIAKMADPRAFQTEKGQPALTQTGSLIGTPEYMSPEQARGDSLDSRSDLYSMGIVLYQLLSGDLPFKAENALGVVLKVVTDYAPPPSSLRAGVHPALEAVCMKAIAKGRTDRFQTAKEMRVALREAIGRGSSGGYPDSLSGPIALPPRSSPDLGAPPALPAPPPQSYGSAPSARGREPGMSQAPTMNMAGAGLSLPRTPSSGAGPFVPKDTSSGTALAPQVARKSGAGALFVILVASVGLAVGVGVILVPRLRTGKPNASPSASASAAELDPIEQGGTLVAPLPNASGSLGMAGASSVGALNNPPPDRGATGPSGTKGAKSVTGKEDRAVSVPDASAPSAATTPSAGSSGTAVAAPSSAGSAVPPPSADQTSAPFNASNAHVEIGLTVPSGIKPGPLRKQFDAVRPQLSACYRDALTAKGQRIDGTATFNLSIDTSGVVSGVIVTGIEQLPQATRCFQNTLFHKQFPASALDGPGATAEVWVSLKPE